MSTQMLRRILSNIALTSQRVSWRLKLMAPNDIKNDNKDQSCMSFTGRLANFVCFKGNDE